MGIEIGRLDLPEKDTGFVTISNKYLKFNNILD